MKKHIALSAMMAVLLFLYGCKNNHPLMVPQYADLRTENVVIKAAEGEWAIRHGQPFDPVKTNLITPYQPYAANLVQKDLSAYERKSYRNYVQDVVVEVDGKEKLYGKIIFFKVFENAGSSSAKRKWTVAVPSQYLNAARQGNVAVVYQPYQYNERDWASWVLWMSSMPL